MPHSIFALPDWGWFAAIGARSFHFRLACANARAPALSCNIGTRSDGNVRLRGNRHSRRELPPRAIAEKRAITPSASLLCWDSRSQLRAWPRADTFIFNQLGWLPVSGRGGISHLILPAATLGAALAAILTRMVRGSMIEELRQRLRSHRAGKGLIRTRRVVPSRISQRARSHHHNSRFAIRHAAGRHNRHRINFFVAGHRTPDTCRQFNRAIIRCCRAASSSSRFPTWW